MISLPKASKLAPILLLFTLAAAGAKTAAESSCEEFLKVTTFEHLLSKSSKNLAKDVDYRVRIKSGIEFSKVDEVAKLFQVSLVLMRPPTELQPDFDIGISGTGANMAHAIIELQKVFPPESFVWMIPVVSKRKPELARPIPEGQELEKIALMSVHELRLRGPLIKILTKQNIVFIGDLVQKSKRELRDVSGLGAKGIDKIEQALAQLGLWLGTDIPGWPYPETNDMDVSFASSYFPIFSLESWTARTEDRAAAIFENDWSGLFPDRITVAKVNGTFAFAMMEVRSFLEKDSPVLIRQLNWMANAIQSKESSDPLFDQLRHWKLMVADHKVRELSLCHSIGAEGIKNFSESANTNEPFLISNGSKKRILVLPIGKFIKNR